MSVCENEDPINWELCFFCQKSTPEKLTNPTNKGYESAAKNLMLFYELGELSVSKILSASISMKLFTSEENLKNTFQQSRASWHRSCYLKCNNTKIQRAKARVDRKLTDKKDTELIVPNTRSRQPTEYNIETCLFCGLEETKIHPLIRIMKKSCNDTIIQCAETLQDFTILAKVSERHDLIALEAKYHHKCFNDYKYRSNKAKAFDDVDGTNSTRLIESVTLEEIISYMNEERKTNQTTVFKVADLAKLQARAMKNFGVDCSIHTTRLKDKLLSKCPYLTSTDNSKGKTSLISFKDNVDLMLRSLNNRDYDNKGRAICEMAKYLRDDILKKVDDDNVLPTSLIALVKMILYGPTNSCEVDNDNDDDRGASLRIAELIVFHTIKRTAAINRRHNQQRETSTPVYLAAKLYSKTRQKKLIETAHELGLSISYGRLQNILTEKANNVCELYHNDGVVCPPKLLKGLFTTAAVDNIDHNTSSNTATSAFHGTAITLMQHKFPAETGLTRNLAQQTSSDTIPLVNKKLKQLPSAYAVVPPCFVDVTKSVCPKSEIYTLDASANPLDGETVWLEQTMSDESKLWAVHHATVDKQVHERHSTNIAVLPLFKEPSHSPAMMLHTMNIVQNATKFLHPGQIPVLVADQPLYALLKQLQYLVPDKVGEDKLFLMMGGLHIEITALKLVGQLLDGSGWVEALVQANITTRGRCESMLTASHVVRSRYGHQVTAAALYSLQKKAYHAQQNGREAQMGPLITFEEWRSNRNAQIPQFKFWDLILNLELLVLQFIRSIRTGDYKLYLNSLRTLMPWFFSLDHVHYSRWLSVHLRDLVNLETVHPDLYKHFECGKFVARRTNRPFSGMALDQAHEQMNALLKGDGGMIGLTESPDSLQKWLLAGPELVAMVDVYETQILKKVHSDANDTLSHHSDTLSNQNRFILAVKSLESTMTDLGNPFLEDTGELYNIDTKSVATTEVVNTIKNIEKCGEEQYMEFCRERLNGGKCLHDPIKQNKYALFNTARKPQSKTKAKITGLKNDCSLFSKLYIATCQHRTGNLDSFFSHENQATPPSISAMGTLRSGVKADLLKCLINMSETLTVPHSPPVSAKILDGPAIVHMLSPGNSRTFLEYADTVFVHFLSRELETVSRLDLVWDRYDKDSLKNSAREKRGEGTRTHVTASTKIPKGWANFLRNSSNKEELFLLLNSRGLSGQFPTGKELYMTEGSTVLTNTNRNLKGLEGCNHEEADTRMMVHVSDAVAEGHTKIVLRSVDTDVVVLAVSIVPSLTELEELWVHIGTGKKHQFVSCHGIAASLGPDKANVLPMFHAFTGCDTTSFFCGKGKKSSFETWNVYPTATEGFRLAIQGNIDQAIPLLEKFVIAMYDKSSSCTDVNSCRRQLFTKKDRNIENIPPTRDALTQHLLRAVYQGGHVWGQILQTHQDLPCPSKWGWYKEDQTWKPVWTTLPLATKACIELIRCKCKITCANNRCNCTKRQLKCTDLCGCGGACM